jgi:hypothetical protein
MTAPTFPVKSYPVTATAGFAEPGYVDEENEGRFVKLDELKQRTNTGNIGYLHANMETGIEGWRSFLPTGRKQVNLAPLRKARVDAALAAAAAREAAAAAAPVETPGFFSSLFRRGGRRRTHRNRNRRSRSRQTRSRR